MNHPGQLKFDFDWQEATTPAEILRDVPPVVRPLTLRSWQKTGTARLEIDEPIDRELDAELLTACSTPMVSAEDKWLLEEAIETVLNPRELDIIQMRLEGATLEVCSQKLGRTRERIRQISQVAIGKIRQSVYGLQEEPPKRHGRPRLNRHSLLRTEAA